MAFELFSSYRGDAMPAGDALKVFDDGVENAAPKLRKPRSDRGVARGPRKPVKVEKTAPKGKVGRPRVYNGTHRRIVAAALRKFGLTKGLEFLAAERKLNVSVTLARSVAEEFGITFKVGRPAA